MFENIMKDYSEYYVNGYFEENETCEILDSEIGDLEEEKDEIIKEKEELKEKYNTAIEYIKYLEKLLEDKGIIKYVSKKSWESK